MHGADGRLDLVRAGAAPAQAAADQRLALGDQPLVPPAAVLVGEQDQVPAGVRAGRAAGLGKQHEGEQAQRLRLVWHQAGQQAAEPDGLGGEVRPGQVLAGRRGVALIEDQVDDGEYGAQPFGQIGVLRHAVGNARVADLALGADQSLGHGRLGDQERAGDLGGGQAAKQPQRQRGPGLQGKRRMTAGEHQAEPVVAHGAFLGRRVVGGAQQRCLGMAVLADGLPAEAVDCPVARGSDDPAGRAWRRAGARPAFNGHGEGLLDRLLGEVDIAEAADQDGDRAPVLPPEHVGDLFGRHLPHDAASPRPRPGTDEPR